MSLNWVVFLFVCHRACSIFLVLILNVYVKKSMNKFVNLV